MKSMKQKLDERNTAVQNKIDAIGKYLCLTEYDTVKNVERIDYLNGNAYVQITVGLKDCKSKVVEALTDQTYGVLITKRGSMYRFNGKGHKTYMNMHEIYKCKIC